MIRAALVLLLVAAPLEAQWDRDRCVTCRDKAEHFVAGAAVDILARGPWVAAGWRDKAWKRVAWVAVVGAAYELTDWKRKINGRYVGFGLLDLGADILGAVALEIAW